jgi:hypothetical protein
MATTKTPSAAATKPEATVSPGAATESDEVPRPLTVADLTSSTAVAAPEVAPQLQPPGSAAAAAVQGVAAWRLDARIGALWTSNNPRNAWVWVNSVGWLKLGGATDLAHLGLYQLARLARDTNAVVNYRDEADGVIHEMYVW